MTPGQIAAARERCEKATPGWTVDPHKETDKFTWVSGEDGKPIFGTAGRGLIADAKFAAHARTDLPLALDAIAAKDEEIAELRESYRTLEPCGHAKNFLIGDEHGHFSCTVCRIAELEREKIFWKDAHDFQHKTAIKALDYGIELQRLLESLKREDTPSPRLHHHQMVLDTKAKIARLSSALKVARDRIEGTLCHACMNRVGWDKEDRIHCPSCNGLRIALSHIDSAIGSSSAAVLKGNPTNGQ